MMEGISTEDAYDQKMENILYRSVWRMHIISLMEGRQYGPVTSSVQRGCAVHDCQRCSGGSWGLYLSGENDILQTILLSDFILLWLNSDVAETPSGC